MAIVLYLYWRYKKRENIPSWLEYLPEVLRDLWLIDNSWLDVPGSPLYTKHIKPGSRLYGIFEEIWEMLSPDDIPIESVYGLSNSILASSFANYREILRRRMCDQPSIFNSKRWMLSEEGQELRNYTMTQFHTLLKWYPWNDETNHNNSVPLIFCAHGTDFQTGMSIAANGFSALSTLDSGFFGKGMYFSTYAKYVIPYCFSHSEPSVLVCLVSPGNPFPVIEHPHKEGSLNGQPMVTGHQSHYAIVNKTGMPISSPRTENEFDEWVIGQENQVVPLYLVKLKKERGILRQLWDAEPIEWVEDDTTIDRTYHRNTPLESHWTLESHPSSALLSLEEIPLASLWRSDSKRESF